jgi:hypothetical protein
MHDVYEWLRYINVALCAVLAVVMLARWGAFLRAPVASRYGRLALFAWISSTGYGTWETLSRDVPAGPRVPTVTSVLMLTAVYVAAEFRYDRRARRHAEPAVTTG